MGSIPYRRTWAAGITNASKVYFAGRASVPEHLCEPSRDPNGRGLRVVNVGFAGWILMLNYGHCCLNGTSVPYEVCSTGGVPQRGY